MRERFDRSSFAEPGHRPGLWISRISGILCFGASAYAAVALWREPTVGAVLVTGLAAVVGALLLSLPDYFRLVASLRETPPVPDRIEEAFERAYQDLSDMRSVLEEIADEMERRSGASGAAWQSEVEEEIARLRLDCDALSERLRPVLPEEGAPAKPLPEGLLAKALGRAGRGSKEVRGPTSGKG